MALGVAGMIVPGPEGVMDDFLRVAKGYLGEGFSVIKPKSGSDLILRSKDGMRQIRFDLSNPHGKEPHVNVEEFKKRGLYPDDRRQVAVEGETHAYPKKQ